MNLLKKNKTNNQELQNEEDNKTEPKINIKKERRKEEKERKKEEKAKKKAAIAEAKAIEKARIAELKKDKEELYTLKKNTALKAGRFAVWSMIIFIFLKGVIVSIRPDPTTEVNKTISTFKSEFAGYQEQDNEILAFAQNFAVQYLTYEGKDSTYTERLKNYCTDTIVNSSYKFASGTTANVLYANAYRKEQYSENQYDVWVLMNVEYTSNQTSEDGSITESKSLESTILKIPIFVENNNYIIEDVPVFVNDDIKFSAYEQKIFKAKECSSDITENIKTALTNFYKAYYGQSQSVINYYLSSDADQKNFIGLNGRVEFNKIETIRSYYKTEETTTDFIVILTVSVLDKNGIKMNQNYNTEVILKDNQYYIVDMNTRNTNILVEEKK